MKAQKNIPKSNRYLLPEHEEKIEHKSIIKNTFRFPARTKVLQTFFKCLIATKNRK